MADTDSAAEFLQDLIATNPNLVYLEDEFPEVKVVVSADYQVATNNAKVAVVAGGNEETDPLRNNSLTAAVYGDSFQPPSPSSILSAIRGVTNQQGQGCLLLVKEGELRNYKRAAKLGQRGVL